jgi:SagB-type dehydrogenase family enzyme
VPNIDTRAAWDFHDSTKHSLEGVRSSTHRLDWDNQPRPYKLYASPGDCLDLPAELPSSAMPALRAIASPGVRADMEVSASGESRPANMGAAHQEGHAATHDRRRNVFDLTVLASILQYAAGITKYLRHPGGAMPFRAAACTGALYHIELYVVSGEIPGLGAGVYHFDVQRNSLRQLRDGDYRGAVVAATGEEQSVAEAPVCIVCTSTFWRNAWKYQTRAYRHSFWDNGTILANLLAMANAHGLPARIVLGYADDEVNRLIDVDAEHEAAVSLVALGNAPEQRPPAIPPVERLGLETLPLSRHREVEYPGIRIMHSASSLDAADVAAWRSAGSLLRRPRPEAPAALVSALRPIESETITATIEEVIRRRGSSRQFDPSPVSFEALSTILATATRSIPTDFDTPLNDIYLIANGVDGLAGGTYVFHREADGEDAALEQLRAGEFRREAGYLDLGQRLGADAAVNVYFLADLEPILARYGNRGYRAAQLEASITAGKIYLASYALGLGATGLTFFDDDVTRFFSPHALAKSVMFLIALGNPIRRTPMSGVQLAQPA